MIRKLSKENYEMELLLRRNTTLKKNKALMFIHLIETSGKYHSKK